MPLEDALALRRKNPDEYIERAMKSMAVHVEAMLALQKQGAVVFDYGNNIRAQAKKAGVKNAFDIPGFVPEYIRPLFCEGRGPFRWVALSGDTEDIRRTDKLALELFPKNQTLARWLELAEERIQFQGLPARICWLGYGERAEFGLAMNELVKRSEIKAPIVIGRDHLDSGSVASPNRETEDMLDGSDAIADWPLLNALINTAAGASWVSISNQVRLNGTTVSAMRLKPSVLKLKLMSRWMPVSGPTAARIAPSWSVTPRNSRLSQFSSGQPGVRPKPGTYDPSLPPSAGMMLVFSARKPARFTSSA